MMYQEFVATLAVCLLAIIVFLNFEILRSTQENNRASFTTVEKAKLKQLDAAIDTCKVPR
jgi:type II secretory pathway component PulJ